MRQLNTAAADALRWLFSRVAVIYILVLLFCLTCVDLKTLEMRFKARRLNSAIPDFAAMINFSRDSNDKHAIIWAPYKKYFELILRYLPDDVITGSLLGFVDFYAGDEPKAIALFKSSGAMHGQNLFWPNYDLGVLYYKKGMWPQSTEFLFKAVASNPKLTAALMRDSLVYRQMMANPAFTYNLDDEIKDAQSKAFILLLSSLHSLRQYDKMLVFSDVAIAHQDLFYKDAFYYYAGLAFYEMGQTQKAFLLFQKSLSVVSDNPDVYYYLAQIYQKAGRPDQARDFLQVSLTAHQKNDPRFPYDKQIGLRFF